MIEEKKQKTEKMQRRLQNLKPFKPGQSGNPKGRKKGAISITSAIKRKLKEMPEGKNKTYLEYMINVILKKATIDEDEKMIKTIWNYVDGMPKQAIDLKTKTKPQNINILVLANILKKADEKTREQFITIIKQLEQSGNMGSHLSSGLADNGARGDLQQVSKGKTKQLETGKTT